MGLNCDAVVSAEQGSCCDTLPLWASRHGGMEMGGRLKVGDMVVDSVVGDIDACDLDKEVQDGSV